MKVMDNIVFVLEGRTLLPGSASKSPGVRTLASGTILRCGR
ncbi:hypothetical protein AVDCRST_MAG82-1668 [uncultured Rubrobacteraceae bacterium]|uniref:Uncharacterized protein n=1 Tax=uncultured Rubrobacteraceae bacterium TaxID=349277 RepID=A0A6J4PZZ5_9ACTN|nr:hypothetical protein AVDCRST_MAG82-1668 [uncultured Rubrobacteraceae bacterium]